VTSWRPERIVIGTVGKAHGLDGSVYLNGYGGAVPLDPGTAVRVGGTDATVAARKGRWDRPVVRFDLAADRTAVEALRGLEVTVDAGLLPEPEEDEYLHVDLIGCMVRSGERELGAVRAVHEYPANDVLELEGGEMLPFVDDVVVEVDVPGRSIRVLPDLLPEE
jgi:16S rRNA processing protein RimM